MAQTGPNEDESTDVTRLGLPACWERFRNNRLGSRLSPMKGTEMLSRLVKFQTRIAALRSDKGATAVEYGLMVALIAIVVIGAVTLLGSNLSTLFQNVATKV
jgi:pilus assembly protein Flp/PilA